MRREAASISLTCMPSNDLAPHVIVDARSACRVDEDFSGDKTRRRYAVSCREQSRCDADPYDLACHYYCTPRDRSTWSRIPPGPHVRDPPACCLHRLTPREGGKKILRASLHFSAATVACMACLLAPHRHTKSDRPYAYGCMIALL